MWTVTSRKNRRRDAGSCVGPHRGCVFCAERFVPRLCKGDSLKEKQSQENCNTRAYNGVQHRILK